MSSTRVRYSVGGASVGLDFGDLQRVTEHTGLDKVSYVDIRWDHGIVQMTADQLAVLIRRGQEALTGHRNVWPLNNIHDAAGGVE